MTKLLLMNVCLNLSYGCDCFTVDKYSIYPQNDRSFNHKRLKHEQNGFVRFNGDQCDSILFSGGIYGSKIFDIVNSSRKRKYIDDILVVGSILNGWNWIPYSRKNSPSTYPTPHPYLENVIVNSQKLEIEKYFEKAMTRIKDVTWQNNLKMDFILECC